MTTTHRAASGATLTKVREVLHQATIGNVQVTHALRYAIGKYKSVSRKELLDLAADARLRASTADTIYHGVRSGRIAGLKELS